ncbi:MAG: hypothetical protein CFK52_13715 [Chloracidobacterium sp. CP2_5A]|nr:MAG: hypothetical protein CFK52_13715 [Chloracidobacterium sp. CP2_5A]
MDDRRELFAALARAQGAIRQPQRSKTVRVAPMNGAAYTFSYAPLEEVVASIAQPLAANGLCWWQAVEGESLATYIGHESGQVVRSAVPLIPPRPRRDKDGNAIPPVPQEWGAALTYARRYGLTMALGLASEDDDDAASASGAVSVPVDRPRAARAKPEPRPEQTPAAKDDAPSADEIMALIQETGTDLQKVLDHFSAASVDTMPATKRRQCVALLEKKKAKA